MNAAMLSALAGKATANQVTAPRGIGSSKVTADAQKYMQHQQQDFAREQRDYIAGQYESYGIPFIPGLTTSGGSSPLPRHTQALGNRNVTSSVPGLAPVKGAPVSGVSGAMGIPLLR
jgi:hypothetical protein